MRSKHKGFYSLLIIVVLLCISVGYAILNRTLNITGNSSIVKNTWNIYFDNVSVTNGSVENDSLPVIDTQTKSTVDFNVMLNLPGDFYEFTVDVVNDGSIDAKIESVVKNPELTDAQKKYFKYEIKDLDGNEVSPEQVVSKNSIYKLKVRVEYRTDLTESDLPTVDESLDLSFLINFVQSDIKVKSINDIGLDQYDMFIVESEFYGFGDIVAPSDADLKFRVYEKSSLSSSEIILSNDFNSFRCLSASLKNSYYYKFVIYDANDIYKGEYIAIDWEKYVYAPC